MTSPCTHPAVRSPGPVAVARHAVVAAPVVTVDTVTNSITGVDTATYPWSD